MPRDCHHPGFGWPDLRRVLSGPAYARRLARRAVEAGADIWTESTVTRWTGERRLQVTDAAGPVRLVRRPPCCWPPVAASGRARPASCRATGRRAC